MTGQNKAPVIPFSGGKAPDYLILGLIQSYWIKTLHGIAREGDQTSMAALCPRNHFFPLSHKPSAIAGADLYIVLLLYVNKNPYYQCVKKLY